MKCSQPDCTGQLIAISGTNASPGVVRRTRKCNQCGYTCSTVEHETETNRTYVPAESQLLTAIALALGATIPLAQSISGVPHRLVREIHKKVKQVRSEHFS